MEYDLKDEGVLDQIVQVVESAENQDRILKHTIDYQIINGNQHEHIKKTLQTRYPKTWDKMTIVDLKIGEKVIRKLSRVYDNGVKREVMDQDTGKVDDKLTELVNYIYADINHEGEDFNDILAKSNRYYSTHDYCEIFAYEDAEGYVRIKAIPQHLLTAIANDEKTIADVIVFKNTVSNFTQVKNFIDWDLLATELRDMEIIASYTVWSKDDNFTFVRIKGSQNAEDGKDSQIVFKNVVTKNDDNPQGINPYEVMPFTAIKRSTEGHFYPFGSEIPQMSKENCILLCELVTIAINQGFGQAIIYYEGESPPQEINSGCTNVIALPNNEGKSRFEFANANADIRGVLDTALAIVRMLLSTNDLTTDKVSGELQATNFASAIDRLIADSESIEYISKVRKKFINAEQKLFKIIIEILRYQINTQTLPKDYPKITLADISKDLKLKVTFSDIRPMITEKEKIDTIKSADDLGLMLPYEKHLRYNEGLTIEEAKERERLISEEKQKKFTQNMMMQLPSEKPAVSFGENDESEDESSDELEDDEKESDMMESKKNASQSDKENKVGGDNRENKNRPRTKKTLVQ